jgi:hypothetical protein
VIDSAEVTVAAVVCACVCVCACAAAESRLLLSESSGVPCLVEAMKRHASDVAVQIAVIGALRNMSCSGSNRGTVASHVT